jgi:hypothetical protein
LLREQGLDEDTSRAATKCKRLPKVQKISRARLRKVERVTDKFGGLDSLSSFTNGPFG